MQPGQPAPDFKVTVLKPDMTFGERQKSDNKGKWLVILFYPMDFTFVCPSEIIQFADATKKFNKLNTELLLGSCDSQFSHFAWCMQDRKDGGIGNCDCDLFADKTCKMAADYNVLIKDMGVALRGLFIIDDKGILRSCTINDLSVGRSLDECFRTL